MSKNERLLRATLVHNALMKRVFLILLAVWISGCAMSKKQIPEPTPKMAMALGVEHGELVRGHATYLNHCNRCHEHVPPGVIDPELWRGVVPHMAVNAKISKIEEQELMLYLVAAHGTVHGLDLEH